MGNTDLYIKVTDEGVTEKEFNLENINDPVNFVIVSRFGIEIPHNGCFHYFYKHNNVIYHFLDEARASAAPFCGMTGIEEESGLSRIIGMVSDSTRFKEKLGEKGVYALFRN